jgi:translation initiation factor 3 subunit C
MHINIDVMECVYFACSMLIEIPAMAQPENPKRRFYFSKKFGSQLNYYMRNTFVGPPESPREHLLAASLALLKGDWRQANEYVVSLRVWHLFPDPEGVKTMLTQKIKESGLRVYM